MTLLLRQEFKSATRMRFPRHGERSRKDELKTISIYDALHLPSKNSAARFDKVQMVAGSYDQTIHAVEEIAYHVLVRRVGFSGHGYVIHIRT